MVSDRFRPRLFAVGSREAFAIHSPREVHT
jgi:hypothetical protein